MELDECISQELDTRHARDVSNKLSSGEIKTLAWYKRAEAERQRTNVSWVTVSTKQENGHYISYFTYFAKTQLLQLFSR